MNILYYVSKVPLDSSFFYVDLLVMFLDTWEPLESLYILWFKLKRYLRFRISELTFLGQ